MKIFISVLILCMLTTGTWAQSNSTVTGQVVDQATKEKLEFVSVAVFSSGGALLNGSISDKDGRFIINGLEAGEYDLVITFVGYTSYDRVLLIGQLNENYNLGAILMAIADTKLDEVVISGERSEIGADLSKKSYSMSNNIAQSGGSVMDAMKAMPSVSFDQDGKVILRGSDQVIVLIDGKQSSLTGYGNQKGLDNIPAANIERIEIINNPSAKYDASGMAGIINIIYKKEKQSGLHGSIGMAYGLGAVTRRKDDLPTQLGSYSPTPKYIPSLDLGYRNEKINFFLQSEMLFQKKLPNNEFTTRLYQVGREIASQVPENRTQDHYIIKGGIDFLISESNSLSFSGIYDWESHVDTAQVAYIDHATGNRRRYITWNEEEVTGYLNFALQYEHKFEEPGRNVNAQLQYSRGWEDETYFLYDSSFVRKDGRDVTSVLGTEHITSFSLDYTHPTGYGRLESGIKLRLRDLPVTYEQQRGQNSILYEGLGNFSEWGENLYAGYANWVHEKRKYDIEGGIRAEYTSVFYNMDEENIYYENNDSYEYFKFFPNFRFTYKLNDHNRISAFYNFRIDRPGEPELRMYSKSDDHELVKVGNPYLRPQFTHSVELAYKRSWTKGSVFLSGYFRDINDSFMRIYTQDFNSLYDVVVKSYANTGKSNNIGFELVVSQEMTNFWKLSGNFNYYKNKIHSYIGGLLFPYYHEFEIEESSESTWDSKIISTIDIPDGFQIQFTGVYFADRIIPQGKQLSRSSIDLGIKKKLWAGKGEIIFSASDIMNRFGIRQEIAGDGFVAEYQNYFETQVFRIALKYKF